MTHIYNNILQWSIRGMLSVFVIMSIGLFTSTDAQAQESLFFSEYIEGSSNNKALEIFNPTADTVFLSGWAFPNVSNAPTTPGEYEFWNDFPDTAYIAPGAIYVIAHPSADATILEQADYTFTYLSNGDDGFALVKGDSAAGSSFEIIDWIGSWDEDPGSGWDVAGIENATANHTLMRRAFVNKGNSTALASFGSTPSNSEWIVKDQDYFGNIGLPTPNEPGIAPESAELDTSKVFALFSEDFQERGTVDTWKTGWSVANYEEVTLAGNKVKKIYKFRFCWYRNRIRTIGYDLSY